MIDVIDNGTGISEERLQWVKNSLKVDESQEGDRIGLRNVHQRLILSYGASYGLHISSMIGEGTQISFKVPATD